MEPIKTALIFTVAYIEGYDFKTYKVIHSYSTMAQKLEKRSLLFMNLHKKPMNKITNKNEQGMCVDCIDKDCAICLEAFTKTTDVRVVQLECNIHHFFHIKCL